MTTPMPTRVAELGQAGQAAEIEREEDGGRGARGPDDVLHALALQFADRAAMVERALIDEVAVVHAQADHDRRAADADDGKLAEEEPGGGEA